MAVTIRECMELAGRNLLENLSPASRYLPFFDVIIEPDMTARCSLPTRHGVGEYTHNVGRWWDAMLRLEAATGFVIPADIEAAMLGHLRDSLDNEQGICYRIDEAGRCEAPDDHSQREVLLSLSGLVRRRNSAWAADAGRRMIRGLERHIPAEPPRDPSYVSTHGRLIEAFLEFYEATLDPAALSLAGRLAEFHFDVSTLPDGTVPDPPSVGGHLHTHSLLNTHRGLLRFGEVTRQREYVDRVAATYRRTFQSEVTPSGFISHNWGWQTLPETTSPGDIAQLALWLARNGHGDLLADAERIVRARLLPCQITGPLGLRPAHDDGTDEHARLEERSIGSFGGMHTHPHGGNRPTTDVTAADLHTICDIYNHIAESTHDGLRINFHFDYEDDDVTVVCERNDVGRLSVIPRTQRNLWLRVPTWCYDSALTIERDGRPTSFSRLGSFAHVGGSQAGSKVTLEYPLPVTRDTELLDDVAYEVTWRGDDVLGISPNTDFLPFYATSGA